MPHKQINLEYFIGRESPYTECDPLYLILTSFFGVKKVFFMLHIVGAYVNMNSLFRVICFGRVLWLLWGTISMLLFLGPSDRPCARISSLSPSPFPSSPPSVLSPLMTPVTLVLVVVVRSSPPLANYHPEGPASCKLSSRGAGLLQIIIRKGRPLINDHPEGPASCKWSSRGAGLSHIIIRRTGLLKMNILRGRPFTNDHPEGPASCKWLSPTPPC